MTQVADGKTLLGKRLIIEESLTKMRLLFMIERVKHQRALDRKRRKLVKKKWKFILPLFRKQQKTGKQLENVYEYLSLNRSRIEIINVLEKLESEDTKINKAKTDLEKFSETLGRFCTYRSRMKHKWSGSSYHGPHGGRQGYRDFLADGPELEQFDRMWGLREISHTSEDKTLKSCCRRRCSRERFWGGFAPYFLRRERRTLRSWRAFWTTRRDGDRHVRRLRSWLVRKDASRARLMRAESRAGAT